MENAATLGDYLMQALRNIPGVPEVRGRGLMIGIDLPTEQSDVRQRLLYEKGVFTGEAKPNVIRLLPSLALKREEAEYFLGVFKQLMV